MPRPGGITRRGGDRIPEKNLWSHTHDALQHGLSGIDRQERRDRRKAAGVQSPPRTLVSGGLDG